VAQQRGRRAQHRSLTPNPMRKLEQFRSNLRTMMRRFVLGQNELLVTAELLEKQRSTMDSLPARVEEGIRRTFPDLGDEDVFQALSLLGPLLEFISSPRPEDEAEQKERNRRFGEKLSKAANELEQALPAGHAYGCIDAALQATRSSTKRLSRVSASLLISLVAEFEVLVANLFGELFRYFPDSTISKDKGFSWEYINDAATLEDLKEQIIEEAVSAAMYSSYGTWLGKFETFGITLPSIARAAETVEIFQRRHVVVHNGGRVSAVYLDKVKIEPLPRLESVLEVSLEYLTEAADNLFAVGARLYTEVVGKIFNEEAERRHLENTLSKDVYDLLARRRFEALIKVVDAVEIDQLVDPELKENFRVNKWLALKRLGRFEEIRSEVEEWNTGDESGRLRLAKLALLDRIDDGLQLIGKIRGTKDLSIESWATWPLLEELRRAENQRTLEQGGVQDTLDGVDDLLERELP